MTAEKFIYKLFYLYYLYRIQRKLVSNPLTSLPSNSCGRKKCRTSCTAKFFSEVGLDRSRRRVFSRVSSSDVVDSSKAELSGLDGGLFCCTSRVSTGGLATSDVPLRSEISVSNRSIICFCSSATCWSHEIICEWPSGWRCGKRLRGVERNEHGLRVCAGDRGGDSTGGSGERTGGRGDSGVHDNGEMVLWVIEVLVVAVALVMVSIVSETFVVLVDVLA